jgi:hypothetical protein
MKAYKMNNADVSKLGRPFSRFNKITLRQLTPARSASGTMKKMSQFLTEHHQAGQMVGFEMDYENDTTRFNIVTDNYKSEQTLQRFISYHDEDGEINSPDDKFIEIKDGDYVSTVDFKLKKDYWNKINSYQNLSTQQRDPLDKIVTEMSGYDSDVSFKFQVLAQPIAEHRWKRRYPVFWMTKGILLNLYKAAPALILGAVSLSMLSNNIVLGMLLGAFFLLYMVIPIFRNLQQDYISVILDTVTESIQSLTNLPSWLNGMSYEQYKNEFLSEEDPQADQNRQSKLKQDSGYLVQMRLIAVGDSKSEVEQYTNEVTQTIEQLSREQNEDIRNPQQLVGTQKQSKKWVLETGANMVGRDSGVDFNGRFTNKTKLASLRVNRTEPTIMTADEIAGFMHFIEDSKHKSILYN